MKNNKGIEFGNLSALQEKVRKLTIGSEDKKPLIGISANHAGVDQELRDNYIKAIIRSGGAPYIIPYSNDTEATVQAVERCHGILVTGGADAHPLWYGEEPHPKLGAADWVKDGFDMAVIITALERGIPLLGICRGMQLLNVVLGGSIIQDIPSARKDEEGVLHIQTSHRSEPWHTVRIERNSRLFSIFGEQENIYVNSFHHQAVCKPGKSVYVSATASDGIIEAIDTYPEHNAIGVQWHPEAMVSEGDSEQQSAIFSHLVKEATLYAEARTFHGKHLTLDSHTDTPMLFKDDGPYDLTKLSDEALVDLPKMRAGNLDAVVMAAYLPQGEISPDAHRKAYEYALERIRKLRTAVKSSGGAARLAFSSKDLYVNKENNRKSIILGIENGYALGGDPDKVEEFAKMGIKYITLCHNGDNAICDSASRSSQTHNGLSPLGREIVRQMNTWGVMVDVSHAGIRTIEDVLEVSASPIIASHSGARAICDHPRNLYDEQIRAIAENGGVVQVCMYKGFVYEPSEEASLLHVIDHIEHIRDLVGIDHVGIGSDFDGDGEVIGCRDASAMKRLTVEMLRRGFSTEELMKVWGHNFLRVMKDVQMKGYKIRQEKVVR
ncbi:MAG: membrane dipeptidase [Porphyromonas sp.]|nr:membrane dipeptidase [Porphyromonas sp.]